MKKRIGIFGGTFNPPHNGHMLVARAAMEQMDLDEMHIMTGGTPPHKDNDNLTPAEIRHEMVKIATGGELGFTADDFEVNKKSYTYTSETLEALLKIHDDWEIYFVIGEDSLKDFSKWHNPKYIASHCTLLVYPRSDPHGLKDIIDENKKKFNADIRRIKAPLYGISSTEIRNRIKEGKSVRYLVPDSIREYIEQKGLYKGIKTMTKQEMRDKLKKALNKKRYEHSLGVCEEAVKMAKRFGADAEKAYYAGLLHDCAKCLEPDEERMLCKKYSVELDEMTKLCHPVAHAPLGAVVAKYEYGIDDCEILNAIRYHTVAWANMTLLDKIIYTADMIEPNRDFDGVDKLRKLAEEDINDVYFECVRQSLMHNIERKTIIHPNTLEAWNAICKKK